MIILEGIEDFKDVKRKSEYPFLRTRSKLQVGLQLLNIYRYKMPKMILKQESRLNGVKTNIFNLDELAKALRVPEEGNTFLF